MLSALPVGFGLAALAGDALLPCTWGNSQRGFAGASLTCLAMVAAVFLPVTVATVVPLLALAGLDLGIFVPANNTVTWVIPVTGTLRQRKRDPRSSCSPSYPRRRPRSRWPAVRSRGGRRPREADSSGA